jgi:hypothetical protein
LENRKKAAKSKVEMNKVMVWMENFLEDLKLNYKEKEKDKSSFNIDLDNYKTSEMIESIRNQYNERDENFIDFFYKFHSCISYSVLELQQNLKSTCNVRAALLSRIYERILELVNFQNSFVAEFMKNVELIHKMHLKQLDAQHDEQLERKDEIIQDLKDENEKQKKINGGLEERIRILKSRIGNYYYALRNERKEKAHLEDKNMTLETEKDLISDIVYDVFSTIEG